MMVICPSVAAEAKRKRKRPSPPAAMLLRCRIPELAGDKILTIEVLSGSGRLPTPAPSLADRLRRARVVQHHTQEIAASVLQELSGGRWSPDERTLSLMEHEKRKPRARNLIHIEAYIGLAERKENGKKTELTSPAFRGRIE